MARRVFFSFHYEKDAWRASQVRNSWVTKPDRDAAGFLDAADWEQVKRGGENAVRSWIDKQLEGTSVTAVLIGAETANREYVLYEIDQSYKERHGLLGIYIHNLKDQYGKTDYKGSNPLSSIYPTYDWVSDNGYERFAEWVERAATDAGR